MKIPKKGDDKYMTTVKIGPKGQIVIPKEVREMFDLSAGDTMILMADVNRGVALQRADALAQISDAIFNGKAKAVYPQQSEEDSMVFAKAIYTVIDEEDK